MLESDLLALSDANLAESHREFARFHPEGLVQERKGLLLTRGAHEHPGLNFAMRVGPETPPPREVLTRAQRVFARGCNGFAVRARQHLDADLIRFMRTGNRFNGGLTVGMVRQGALPEPKASRTVQVKPVTDEDSGRIFAQVAGAAFATEGLSREVSRSVFSNVRCLLAPYLHPVIAYVDDKPVSVTLALLCHGAAGIYWVGTVREARGQGLAGMVLRAAHNWACDHGARAVVLQCAPKHQTLYERHGYRELTHYPWFIVRIPPVRKVPSPP